MKNEPQPPLIVIDHEIVSLYPISQREELEIASILGITKFKPHSVDYFDSKQVWDLSAIKYNKKIRWIDKIRNPIVPVKFEWRNKGDYSFVDLRDKVITCIYKDDDVLTQFVETDFLAKKVGKTEAFSELLSILNKYVFEVNEEELYEEEMD